MENTLKVGTRASPLALAQAELFISSMQEQHPALSFEIVKITTTGDKIQDRALSEAGGKGLFTKEVEEHLLEGKIDFAVHSMKDMPTQLPEGLIIPCFLPREDPRDAFFSFKAKTIMELPQGAVVGTASLRRQSIVKSLRPDLKVVVFRGSVGTRLDKLKSGEVDATLLAAAGLKRLGKLDLAQELLEPEAMLPAVAQGTVGIEVRADNLKAQELLKAVHCQVTELRTVAERAFLEVLDGSCKTPLAALMSVPDNEHRARLDILVARPDGSDVKKASHIMEVKTVADAVKLGRYAGEEIKAKLPAGYLDVCNSAA